MVTFWRSFVYPTLCYPVELLREAFSPSPEYGAVWPLEYEWLEHLRWRIMFAAALLVVLMVGLGQPTAPATVLAWFIGYVFIGLIFSGISAVYCMNSMMEQFDEESSNDEDTPVSV